MAGCECCCLLFSSARQHQAGVLMRQLSMLQVPSVEIPSMEPFNSNHDIHVEPYVRSDMETGMHGSA